MEYSAWHSVIQDGNGAVVPMAKITVRNTATGALAKLYSARDGSAPKANPFNADENGQVFFFVAGGAYTIKAEFGSQERTWPFVPVGTAAEYDIDSLALYLNSGVVYFQKYADLGTYVPLSYPAAAVVLADPDALKNGYYTNSGTGWIFGRALQDTISRLFITGGAVNTPTATVGQGINPSAPLVFYVDVSTPNTASVTLNVVGLGKGVVLNAAGNPLAAGEWQGRVMITREIDGRYLIMNDPASALSAAQSATTAGSEKDAAIAANAAAQVAKTAAETASSQAQAAKSEVDSAKTAAENAKNAAQTANSGAQSAKTAAEAAKDSAGQSAVSAASSASSAASSASTASNKASDAASSASSASGSAGAATAQANRAETEANRAEAAAGSVNNPVSYSAQTPSATQKAQARENIGLGNVANKSEAQMVASGAVADALVGKLPLAGGDMSGQINLTALSTVVTAGVYGVTLPRSYSGMYGGSAPVVAHSQTTGNNYCPVIKMTYDFSGWTGVYSTGVLHNGTASQGAYMIHHIQPDNNGQHIWQFSGINGDFAASGNVGAYSDERLKTERTIIDKPFKKLSFRGMRYFKDGKYSYGFMAQEVEKSMPELISETMNPDDQFVKNGERATLILDQGNGIPALLVECVLELKKELEELRRAIQ